MTKPPSNPPPGLPKLPLILLGLLTIVTFAGPFALLVVIQGGERREWPPDRQVEWWTFITIISLGVSLVAGCVATSLWSRKGPG